MKLNEFLRINNLQLKIFVCGNGTYRCGFYPNVEISDGIFLRSECGDAAKDIKTAIKNTLENISNKTLKINNERYISVFSIEL